tara:strand:+ start:3839 stop:4207 length:369 start_codon:yes stop_codon:yes gene_type:complete
MSLDNAVQTYKNAENIYAKGIETPHGRIQIVFDVIQKNLDKLTQCHPKTDFIAYGKALQGIVILSGSLDMEKGGQIADELNELYAYCDKTLREYLESKNSKKLEEVLSIISGIADSWAQIEA